MIRIKQVLKAKVSAQQMSQVLMALISVSCFLILNLYLWTDGEPPKTNLLKNNEICGLIYMWFCVIC